MTVMDLKFGLLLLQLFLVLLALWCIYISQKILFTTILGFGIPIPRELLAVTLFQQKFEICEPHFTFQEKKQKTMEGCVLKCEILKLEIGYIRGIRDTNFPLVLSEGKNNFGNWDKKRVFHHIMLHIRAFCLKQQNKIRKIFKNSKFHFFKIEPKLCKTNL